MTGKVGRGKRGQKDDANLEDKVVKSRRNAKPSKKTENYTVKTRTGKNRPEMAKKRQRPEKSPRSRCNGILFDLVLKKKESTARVPALRIRKLGNEGPKATAVDPRTSH